jgi:hypothetical protein
VVLANLEILEILDLLLSQEDLGDLQDHALLEDPQGLRDPEDPGDPHKHLEHM